MGVVNSKPKRSRLELDKLLTKEDSILDAYINLISQQLAISKRDKLSVQTKSAIMHKVVNQEVGEPKNPLLVFPEELWLLILNQAGTEVQYNCVRASPLLRALLDSKITMWLFHKVLPFLVEYLGYDDLVSSAKAFPEWKTAIFDLVDEHSSNPSHIRVLDQPWKGCGTVQNIKISETFVEHCTRSETTEIPTRRISKSIIYNTLFTNNNVTVVVKDGQRFWPEFEKFLENVGNVTRHLTLVGSDVMVSPVDVYKLCWLSLKKCKNLKSLTLEDWKRVKSTTSAKETAKSIFELPQFQSHLNLESLNISFFNPLCLLVVDQMLGVYSNQMKNVEIRYNSRLFYQVYDKFSFQNLVQFNIPEGNTTEVLSLLENADTPNLQVLKLHLDQNRPTLKQLVNVLVTKPKLYSLDLQANDQFIGWTNSEILDVEVINCVNNNVIFVQLSYEDKISLDFLVCFPNLQSLVLRKKEVIRTNQRPTTRRRTTLAMRVFENFNIPGEAKSGQEISDEDVLSKLRAHDKYLKSNLRYFLDPTGYLANTGLLKLKLQQNSFRVIPCIPNNIEQIYASQLWELFPKLKYIDNLTTLYPRSRYNWFKVEFARRAKVENSKFEAWIAQMQLFRKSMPKADTQRRRSELQKKLSDQRELIFNNALKEFSLEECMFLKETWTETMGNIDNLEDARNGYFHYPLLKVILKKAKTRRLFPKVFPLIFCELTKKDVLKCRLVCQKWNTTVDSYLKNSLCSNNDTSESQANCELSLEDFEYWVVLHIEQGKDSFSLVDQLTQHTRNPLVGSAIHIVVGSKVNYLLNVIRKLEKIQEHVWHLKLTIRKEEIITADEYFRLCESILNTFQALRSISFEGWGFIGLANDDKAFRFDDKVLRLPPVETLAFESNRGTVVVHKNLVKLFSNQLKCLVTNDKEIYLEWLNNSSCSEKLKELELTHSVNNVEYVKLSCLKRLSLQLGNLFLEPDLLYISNNSGSSLKLLELKMNKNFSYLSTPPVGVDRFTCFTDLVLSFTNVKDSSFYILLLFPCLKKLSLRFEFGGYWVKKRYRQAFYANEFNLNCKREETTSVLTDSTECIRLREFLDLEQGPVRLHDSNIWQLLPDLEVVEIVINPAYTTNSMPCVY